MTAELLNIDRLSFRYPTRPAAALDGISLAVRQGECLCLTGSSGCGKSTLLLAIMGLLRGGVLTGSVRHVDRGEERRFSCTAAIVFQNPESQMLCTTVAEEVAFGPENLCVPPDEIARRVTASLAAVGLSGEERRSAERFSAGQKQRVAIAAALAMHPRLLLLDEPASQLDRPGKELLAAILADLKRQGHTMIIAEHDPAPFAHLVDRYLVLEQGRLVQEGELSRECAELLAAPELDPGRGAASSHRAPLRRAVAAPVLEVRGVELSYRECGEVLSPFDLQLARGERVHLVGANGAGKSSLLRCLAGLERPDAGSVVVAGIRSPRPEQLPGRAGVLFQNPTRQLFAESVREEVGFGLRRLGHSRSDTERMAAEALRLCGIEHLADRVPLTLSFGEQHRVTLAAVIAPRPELLLLDEPFAGLDCRQRLALLDILRRMSEQLDTAVLIASHDDLPDPGWAQRSLLLERGSLAAITY